MTNRNSMNKSMSIVRFLSLLAAAAISMSVSAEPFAIRYGAEVLGNEGGNDFAPYYIMSNRHGIMTSAATGLLDVEAHHDWDTSRRFSYGFGVEALGGYASSVDYQRYSAADEAWHINAQRPQSVWLQQLYAQVKYRQVFLSAGLKEEQSRLLDNTLSSGDMVRSINARPIPSVTAGFMDFVDIPLINGWVQIEGQISYGKFTDNGWVKDHYNYYTNHINTGGYYTYKRCYFRTKPSMPFSVTVGMQTAGVFGGTTVNYRNGHYRNEVHNEVKFKTFIDMFFPREGSGEGYYIGNSLGSWDIFMRYRLPDGSTIRGYLQHPFETGSGIGFLNGFDGLWGLEYRASTPGLLNGIVVEYIDTTNQSGPNHWDPDDNPGTTLDDVHTSGGDDYYNNDFYNAYVNYGMAIGSPMLVSPIYNRDGYPGFVQNRIRGCHVALTGDINGNLSYRLMGGYRKGYGTIRQPVTYVTHDTSVMAEVTYRFADVKGLSINGQVAFDCGNMLGDRCGVCVGVSYNGLLNL